LIATSNVSMNDAISKDESLRGGGAKEIPPISAARLSG
jgi:hypothetical protein